MAESSTANCMCIRTSKGEYSQGDTVYGVVYLCVRTHVTSKGIKLKFRGFEKVEYEYSYVDSQQQLTSSNRVQLQNGKRSLKKELLQEEFRLIEYPGGFPIGCFSYSFKYTLPNSLPGVFFHESATRSGKGWKACVQYCVRAELDVSGDEPLLMCEEPMVIYGPSKCDLTREPETFRTSDSVRTFCCIPRGDVNVTAKLSKMQYEAGEKAFVNIEIHNQSSVELRNFVLKVIRVIKLAGKDNMRNEEELTVKCLVDTVAESLHRGCKSHSTVTCGVPIRLAEITSTETVLYSPATEACGVTCHYVVDLDMYIPWAPAVELHLPLVINPCKNTVWLQWKAPPWTYECKAAPVVDTCVVTPQIIGSGEFSCMPGFSSQNSRT